MYSSQYKRRAFWSLNEDILKIIVLKTNTPYPLRKIRRIRVCTHQRPQRNKDQYAVSRENQYALNTAYPLPSDTVYPVLCPIQRIHPNRLIRHNDSEQEAYDDMGYDSSDIVFIEWLGSKNFNYKTMDYFTMKTLWIYWIRGDDKVELTDDESSDNEDDIAKVFRIDTNIFDYETPLCSAFGDLLNPIVHQSL
ncbi:hypothetical protein Tco_0047786 [Tanacetum coccineum]